MRRSINVRGSGHNSHHHEVHESHERPAFVPVPKEPLTNQQVVTRLYRQALRTSRDWNWDIQSWCKNARQIRAKFDQNKNITSPAAISLKIEEGLATLKSYQHPLPYANPTSPGGTKWERNLPPPEWALDPRNYVADWAREVYDDPLSRTLPPSVRPGYGKHKYIADEYEEEVAHLHHHHHDAHHDAKLPLSGKH
eukprot:TRINITY_DN782_c0_g1_i8.p1 TRINITY_DN782_c0_g1~~TRINITY_DN782_c0_g1_i8.p1  ORF type:complete len:195 (+),score=24.68 TRINITY_DN782_c0_g1_i8:98-682(+)